MANESADIDQAGLNFIAKWEGCILRVYRDIAKKKTYGIGHLVTESEDAQFPDGMPISKELALNTLHSDAQICVRALRKYITQPLNQNQIDALISAAFNCGTGLLAKSGVSRAVNEARWSAVRPALLEWSKCVIGGVKQTNKGLYNRRVSEADLFERAVVEEAPQSFVTEEERQRILALVYGTSTMAAEESVVQAGIWRPSDDEYSVIASSDHPDDAEAIAA